MSITSASFSRYSLADHVVTFTAIQGANSGTDLFTFEIGGQGSFLGSLNISWNADTWSQQMDATGSGSYSKNYDRSGTITLSLNQVSEKTILMDRLFQSYHLSDSDDIVYKVTISRGSKTLVEASYCVLKKLPEYVAEEEAGVRAYEFLSMLIDPKI